MEWLHVPEWSTGQWSRPTYRYRTDMAISIPIISPATLRTWAIVGSAGAGGAREDYLEYIDGHYKINSVYGQTGAEAPGVENEHRFSPRGVSSPIIIIMPSQPMAPRPIWVRFTFRQLHLILRCFW